MTVILIFKLSSQTSNDVLSIWDDINCYWRKKYILKQKETSDFHGTVSFDPVKMLQYKSDQIVNQTSDTQKMVIIWFNLLTFKGY